MLRSRGACTRRGGDFDRWDLELRAGILGLVRMDLVVEEHGQGKQLVRFRAWPRCSGVGLALIVALAFVSLVDAGVAAFQGMLICGVPASLLALRSIQECAAGMAAVKSALSQMETTTPKKAEVILQRLTPTEMGVPHATLLPETRPILMQRPRQTDSPVDVKFAPEG